MKIRTIILKTTLTALIFLSLGGVYFVRTRHLGFQQSAPDEGRQITFSFKDVAVIRREWADRIVKVGGKQAYKEFVKKYSAWGQADQHALMHIMGMLLYQKEGAAAIGVCGDEMRRGCFHGFLIAAMQREGLSVLPKLSKYCDMRATEKENPCHHGMGHGFMAYFGDKRIRDALDSCGKLGGRLPVKQCVKGVYMEYNFSTSEDPSMKEGIRTFDPQHPFAPCDTLPTNYRETCFTWQSDWWVHALGKNYQKAGALCGQLSARNERIACFDGIGMLAAFYEPSRAATICGTMPDKDATIICTAAATSQSCQEKVQKTGAPLELNSNCSALQVFK